MFSLLRRPYQATRATGELYEPLLVYMGRSVPWRLALLMGPGRRIVDQHLCPRQGPRIQGHRSNAFPQRAPSYVQDGRAHAAPSSRPPESLELGGPLPLHAPNHVRGRVPPSQTTYHNSPTALQRPVVRHVLNFDLLPTDLFATAISSCFQ